MGFRFTAKTLFFCLVWALAAVPAAHAVDYGPSRAKIFLVAGSSQNANFAQEVLDQRAMWLRQGFAPEEIACYYVEPDRADFLDDASQWKYLKSELQDCYPASVQLLRRHLRAAAYSSNPPDFIYLFVTSHGQRPISARMQAHERDDEDYRNLRAWARYPVMDDYIMAVEGDAQGRAQLKDLARDMDSGTRSDELFLTPRSVQGFLAQYFPDTPKFLVFQGCYSGGFLKDPRKDRKRDSLRELEQVTVLTAANYDRTSFGCDPGDNTTFFGGAFNELLAGYIGNPLTMDWKNLYRAVKNRISALEEQYEDLRPSEPLYFSNYKKKSGD